MISAIHSALVLKKEAISKDFDSKASGKSSDLKGAGKFGPFQGTTHCRMQKTHWVAGLALSKSSDDLSGIPVCINDSSNNLAHAYSLSFL
jgi:hypothetical protein